MKRICVIFTGGTISSRKVNDERDVDPKMAYRMLQGLRALPQYSNVVFDVKEPYHILSENCTFKHWQMLAQLFKELDFGQYEGVIIAHGSDTLPYSAAFLSFVLGACPKPVVFVASNHPLNHPLSTGQQNFNAAVDFILSGNTKGVYVVWKNDEGEPRVFFGTRITEADRYSDNFVSFGNVDFGTIEGQDFVPIEHMNNPCKDEIEFKGAASNVDLKRNVLVIKAYPSQDFSTYRLDKNVAAVLCILYHSATICTDAGDEQSNQRYSFTSFIKRCADEGIAVYLCSFKLDADTYKGVGELIKQGAIPLHNISFEAAYAKLCVAYNCDEDAREFIERDIFFEHLKN